MIRALFRSAVFLSVFAVAITGSPRAASAASPRVLETPEGRTRSLITPAGRRDVLVSKASYWNGRSYSGGRRYQLVTQHKGELAYDEMAELQTPYGTTKVVEADGRLSHQLKIGSTWYEVTARRNDSFVYTDPSGVAHTDVVRVAGNLVTPTGTTRALMTPAGRRDVLVTRSRYGTTYQIVTAKGADLRYDEKSALYTPFGETKLLVSNGRLVQRLVIGKRTFEVIEHEDGAFSYINSEGQTHKHAPRIGSSILTPHGLSFTAMTPSGPREIVKLPESERSGNAEDSAYAVVSVKSGELSYTPIARIATPYGPSTLVLDQGAFRHEIEIDGKTYDITRSGRTLGYLDKQGRPYVDTWKARLQSTEAAPVAIRRLYEKGLPALPAGPIAKIKDQRGTATEHMGKSTYDELRDAMIETMTKYDPRTHYFVGLGSDPHPIIAFLDNLGGRDLAVNFPASGKYNNGLAPSVLAPYVRRLIPAEVLNGTKTLVLLDQTNSGATRAGTLAQIAPVFQAYLQSIGSPAKVKQLAFSPVAQPKGTGHISTARYPEIGKFLSYPYEHVVSQYDRHVLNSNTPEQLIERPEYNQFRRAMMKRMKRDAKLDRFLAGELKLEN